MTHIAKAFKGLIPPTLVSHPKKAMLLCQPLPLDAVGVSVCGSPFRKKRGALGCDPGSQLEFHLFESP